MGDKLKDVEKSIEEKGESPGSWGVALK